MKILIVDDHPMMRDSLSMLLSSHFGEHASILQAECGQEGLRMCGSNPQADLLLLDLDLPDINGFQVLRKLRHVKCEFPIICISGNATANFIAQCMDEGADAFIPKTSSGQQMIDIVTDVLKNGSHAPKEATPSSQRHEVPELTERQAEITRLMQTGMSNQEIADSLNISIETVKTHVRDIIGRLGVHNRTEAVNEALLLHLI